MDVSEPSLMTTWDAAKYLNVSYMWLVQQRAAGKGPQCTRLGQRIVRYLKADLDKFIQDGKCLDKSGE